MDIARSAADGFAYSAGMSTVGSCVFKSLTFVSRTVVSAGPQHSRLITGLTGGRVMRVIREQPVRTRELATGIVQDRVSLVPGLVVIPPG